MSSMNRVNPQLTAADQQRGCSRHAGIKVGFATVVRLAHVH